MAHEQIPEWFSTLAPCERYIKVPTTGVWALEVKTLTLPHFCLPLHNEP
jgi:hypothetical protein